MSELTPALVLAGRAGGSPVVTGSGRVVFVGAVFVASASWQLLLAGGGAVLGRALPGRRRRLVTAPVSSAMIFLVLAADVAAR